MSTTPHVSDIRPDAVILRDVNHPMPSWLAAYAPTHLGREAYKISVASETRLSELLEMLRDHDFAFVGAGSGWPPAEIVADLRDRGVFSGSFNEIVFMGPGRSKIRQR
jgi:hypothetical protein